MKFHTAEEVEKARVWVEQQGFPKAKDHVTYRGRSLEFEHYVMPSSLNKDLPHFVWNCNTVRSSTFAGYSRWSEGVVGISDAVPEEFRKYFVYHELVESQTSADWVKYYDNDCLHALEAELLVLPKDNDFCDRYVAYRRDFFNDLVNYAESHGYERSDIKDFKEVAGMLEGIVQFRKKKKLEPTLKKIQSIKNGLGLTSREALTVLRSKRSKESGAY